MSRSTTTSGNAPQTGKGTQSAAATQPLTPQAGVPLEKVAARAYQKWMQKGCKHGCDAQDWLEAEAEIKAEMARPGAATQTRR
jgi:hypothetical protein